MTGTTESCSEANVELDRVPSRISTRRLGVKVIGVTLIFLAVVSLVSAVLTIRGERDTLLKQIEISGRSLCETVSVMCVDPLLADDYPVLDTYCETFVNDQNDVRFVRVLNQDGKVVSQAWAPDKAVHDVQMHRADIEIDPEDPTVLGQVVVGISTERSRATVTSRVRSLVLQTIGTFLTLTILLAWLLKRMVSDPLRTIDEYAESLGKGELDRPIILRSSDELGRLAQTMDHMRQNSRIPTPTWRMLATKPKPPAGPRASFSPT